MSVVSASLLVILRVRCNADGRARAVEDDELRLEKDVAVDGEWEALVGLETAETNCFTHIST